MKSIAFRVILISMINSAICSKLEPLTKLANTPKGSLQADLEEFLNLIPVDEIRNLTCFFYGKDEAMRESYDYMRNKGFKLVVERLSKLTLIKKFTTFLNESGVDLAELGKGIESIVLTNSELKTIDGNSLIKQLVMNLILIHYSIF